MGALDCRNVALMLSSSRSCCYHGFILAAIIHIGECREESFKIQGRRKCQFWLIDKQAMVHLAVIGKQKTIGDRHYKFEARAPMATLHPLHATTKSDVKAWLHKVTAIRIDIPDASTFHSPLLTHVWYCAARMSPEGCAIWSEIGPLDMCMSGILSASSTWQVHVAV